MKKRAKSQKKKLLSKKTAVQEDTLPLYSHLSQFRKDMEQIRELLNKMDERTSDLEIHVNLLTRLLTTLCIEKLGMRVGVLKRLLKRIENEAVRDSQILHLESLYNLPSQTPDKKPSASPKTPPEKDRWEDIS